jgi:uncharacterized repeat protein (TIGR04052 family)
MLTTYAKVFLTSGLVAISVVACNNDDDDDSTSTATTSTTTTTSQAVTVDFKAAVNDVPFVCGQTYQGVGVSSGATENAYRMDDFRLYIRDVHLVKDDGSEVAITLDQDGVWQYKNIALLDFENGCLNGTVDTNTQVHGQLPSGEKLADYTGLCFTVGLPFEENHADPGQASSPLNASGMLWSWTTGRKFVRIDGVGDPGGINQSFVFHLGSTGCTDSSGTGGAPDEPCTYANQPEICLSNFKTTEQVAVADVGHLFAQSNVTVNTPDTAVGCMSGHNDPECITIMPRAGLDFYYQQIGTVDQVVYPQSTQVFFHTENK